MRHLVFSLSGWVLSQLLLSLTHNEAPTMSQPSEAEPAPAVPAPPAESEPTSSTSTTDTTTVAPVTKTSFWRDRKKGVCHLLLCILYIMLMMFTANMQKSIFSLSLSLFSPQSRRRPMTSCWPGFKVME